MVSVANPRGGSSAKFWGKFRRNIRTEGRSFLKARVNIQEFLVINSDKISRRDLKGCTSVRCTFSFSGGCLGPRLREKRPSPASVHQFKAMCPSIEELFS